MLICCILTTALETSTVSYPTVLPGKFFLSFVIYTVLKFKKRANFETIKLKIIRIDFDDI